MTTVQLKKVILLGSGALKIGEAGEFDYSGTQAIKALKEESIKIILVNPNVATIQTSAGLADEIYFLPVTAEFVERIIMQEKPDGIMLSFGGQTALNCGIDLYEQGVLKRYHVEVMGTPISAIITTEDRKQFAHRLGRLGLATAKGQTVSDLQSGLVVAEQIGYPLMLRTGFALGGTGSGVVKTKVQLKELLVKAFATTRQIIVEEDLTGWKEVEYEVMRDKDDNTVAVCNMENFDPVGIHTGESIVVAPSQTLNDQEYYTLRQVAIDVIRELKIVGECNIQFALNPYKSEYRIIEVNARLSRSSALASKATGYPLAYIAAKLALGKTLPELTNQVTKKTSAFFEPALDYVVVKIPRWDLDKFTNVVGSIGSEMKSVGEVMAISRTFPEALQKAVRMLNNGTNGILDPRHIRLTKTDLLKRLQQPDPLRLFTLTTALQKGISVNELYQLTKIDRWFLSQLKETITIAKPLQSKNLTRNKLLVAKRYGYSDKQIGILSGKSEAEIRTIRKRWHIHPTIKRIDTLAGEFPAHTNYLYLTYNGENNDHIPKQTEKKCIVIGGGPYSIGTSVEFDWCAVNTVITLREHGVKSIIINCNPETVSTDYDYSDYLYFEELTLERVLDIAELEKTPLILSVGGQIPNNLAPKLAAAGYTILGTTADNIYRAEHRRSFSQLLDKLAIRQPAWKEATSLIQAKKKATQLGYPLLIRPSFVLSGKSMSVIESPAQLKEYMETIDIDLAEHPLIITQFLSGAKECDVDGVAQKGQLLISIISEHAENAGVHSGDSTLILPPPTLTPDVQAEINWAVKKIVSALDVTGPFNIQFLIKEREPYVIECNLRASRSFPFVSKTVGHNLISLATKVMLDATIQSEIIVPNLSFYAVKVPQFSFNKLRGADPVLHVEMSSTGEVVGMGNDIYEAYLKAFLATGKQYPVNQAVFVSLGGMRGKLEFLYGCQLLFQNGFRLFATTGTALFLYENSISATKVGKLYENIHPNFYDLINGRQIDFAVVTPERFTDTSKHRFNYGLTDGYTMRRLAVDMGIPIFTNSASALLFVQAIKRYTVKDLLVQPWSHYVRFKKLGEPMEV